MTTHLTSDQRQAIQAHPGTPVYFVDTETNRTYVLLPEEHYERVKPLFEPAAFEIRETYSAQARAAANAGWDDPALDAYETLLPPSAR